MNSQHPPYTSHSNLTRRTTLQRVLSRRDFLMLAGVATGTFASACGAISIGVYWLLTHDEAASPGKLYSTTTPSPNLAGGFKTLQRPRIITRSEWGARPIDAEAENETGMYGEDNPEGWREYDGVLFAAYQTLIIHHSVRYDTDDATTVRAIQDLHMDDRGWADVGYHFLVGKDGALFEGRALKARGTHTASFNTGSVGVCLLGDFQTDEPTPAQLAAATTVCKWLAVRLQLTHIAGHRDFNDQTLCPGDNLYPLLDTLAATTDLQPGTEGYTGPSPQPTSTNETTAWQCCCCST